jgi:hypothetical protein
MFTSRVRTGLGEELTLPNSFILASVTRNTRGGQERGIRPRHDRDDRLQRALASGPCDVIEAARRTEGVLAEPKPRVYQIALEDFYIEYRLVCQAIPSEPRPRAEVLSALHANIVDVFNEHGVQIMSPHYLGDPAREKVVPPAKWYAAPAEPPR